MVVIISHNVNGLRDSIKRRGIFMHNRSKADIVCLQETHSEPNDEKFWSQEFRGNLFFSHGSTNSRGVAILIRQGADVQVRKTVSDHEGRYIGIEFLSQGETFNLNNIYAPNTDTPDFFLEVFRKIEQLNGKRIVTGDFNLTLNTTIDRTSSISSNNNNSAEILKQYMEDTYMTDIWRDRNPDSRSYTYCRNKPRFIGSRLDFFLTEISLNAWIDKTKILPGYRSDHSAVLIELTPYENHRGKGLWRMNGQILYETEYLKLIQNTIEKSTRIRQRLIKTR